MGLGCAFWLVGSLIIRLFVRWCVPHLSTHRMIGFGITCDVTRFCGMRFGVAFLFLLLFEFWGACLVVFGWL